MPYSSASAIEIDKKLRDDFRRRLRDYGISAETTDPILAVLFRTLAQQLENLYSETGRIRLALLDELIAGLGVEQRMARPAQTVARFLLPGAGSQVVEAGTELMGEAQTGERLTFTTDATIAVSQAAIAMAFTYQEGALQLMPGMELPERIQNARPALDPVKVNLGPHPAVILAIEKLPASHLSLHSFFFELGPDAARIQEALESETWCLFGASGELHSRGILRPRTLNAGVRGLQWLAKSETAEAPAADGRSMTAADVPVLPPGFYGERVFVMPPVDAARRTMCAAPRGMEAALGRVFGREYANITAEKRAWVRISFPREVPSLHTGIGSIAMHAITASNVECHNQTVHFDEKGTSIPISVEAGTDASELRAGRGPVHDPQRAHRAATGAAGGRDAGGLRQRARVGDRGRAGQQCGARAGGNISEERRAAGHPADESDVGRGRDQRGGVRTGASAFCGGPAGARPDHHTRRPDRHHARIR